MEIESLNLTPGIHYFLFTDEGLCIIVRYEGVISGYHRFRLLSGRIYHELTEEQLINISNTF